MIDNKFTIHKWEVNSSSGHVHFHAAFIHPTGLIDDIKDCDSEEIARHYLRTEIKDYLLMQLDVFLQNIDTYINSNQKHYSADKLKTRARCDKGLALMLHYDEVYEVFNTLVKMRSLLQELLPPVAHPNHIACREKMMHIIGYAARQLKSYHTGVFPLSETTIQKETDQ